MPTDNQSTPNSEKAPRQTPWALIGAIVFLLISLSISAVILFEIPLPSFSLPAAQGESTQPTGQGSGDQQDGNEVGAATQTPEAETPLPPGVIIAVAPLNDAAPDIGDALIQALRDAAATSPLQSMIEVRSIDLPSDASLATMSDAIPGTADYSMLVTWESGAADSAKIYVIGNFAPPTVEVGAEPQPWSLETPQDAPIYAGTQSDFALPAGVAIDLAELHYDAAAEGEARLQTLQSLPPEGSPEMQAANQAVILFSIGQMEFRKGNLTDALTIYSQSLRLNNAFSAAALNRGNIYLLSGDFNAGLAAFQPLTETEGYGIVALYDQILAHRSARDFDAALAAADKLVSSAPDADWSYNLRGIIYYEQGAYSQALEDFTEAITLSPDEPAFIFNRAKTLVSLGSYEQAIETYNRLVSLVTDNPAYYLELGTAYQLDGDTASAERQYSIVITRWPDRVDAYVARGELAFEQGEYEQALADAGKALEIDPENGQAYRITGNSLLAQEEFGDAEAAYSQAIDRGVNSLDVFEGRGWARHQQRKLAGAINDYEQALALGANDNVLLFRLGFAYFDSGQYEESLSAFQRAVDGGLDTAEAHAALALALDANLKRDAAEEEYQQALELDARFGDEEFLSGLPLWSDRAVIRARTIFERIDQ